MDHRTKQIIDRLQSFSSVDEARRAISRNEFGDIGSPNHNTAMQWLRVEEAVLDDRRKEETLSLSRQALLNSKRATRLATLALVLSVVVAIEKVVEWLSK